MKIKIHGYNIIYLLVTILLLSSYDFFKTIYISGMIHSDYRIIFIIGLLLSIILYKKVEITQSLKKYICGVAISISILAIYTFFSYPLQSFYYTSRAISQYLLIIWVIPILFLIEYDNGAFKLFEIMNLISLIWCVLIVIQAGFYQFTGNSYFDFIEYGVRGGNARIDGGALIGFTIIYSFWRFYCTKDKYQLYHFFSFSIMMFANFMVQATRMANIGIIIVVLFMIFSDRNRVSKLFVKIIASLAICIVAFFTSTIQDFFYGLSTNYATSYTIHLYGLEYYSDYFLKHPIFGFGLLKDYNNYLYILRGPLGVASMDDVGIVGQFAILGIFAFVIIISFYIMIIKKYLNSKDKLGNMKVFFVGIIIYLLVSSISLIIFDQQRIVLLPFILAFFDFYCDTNANINSKS